MSKPARLRLGFLAATLAVASIATGTGVLAAPAAVLWSAPASEAAPPSGDPNVPEYLPFHLLNARPCVNDEVVLVVAVPVDSRCDSLVGAVVRDPTHVVYHTWQADSVLCDAFHPHIVAQRLELGRFPAGPHKIDVEWVMDHTTPSGGAYTEVRHVSIGFEVSADCTVYGRLPYVDLVQIGLSITNNTPPCVPPGDSIPVFIAGQFPSGCFHLSSIEVLPDLTASLQPHSPRIRLTVEDCACCDMLCREQPVRWSATAKLPPLQPSDYKLPIELVRTSCSNPIERFAAGFPFVVAERCGGSAGCLIPGFSPGGSPSECDVQIEPGHPVRLALQLNTTVALAKLQGELAFGDTALRIGWLQPAGPAEHMTFRWERTPRGGRFALSADPNGPFPPAPPGEPAQPLLEVGIEVVEGRQPAPMSLLVLNQLVAADPAGLQVPWCPTILDNTFRFAAYARICAANAPSLRCDYNGDGHEDIRDLVLMMRCLRELRLCGDVLRFDCNQDQAFTIDDVLCCAEGIVGRDCAGCPPGETRDPGNVKIGFGIPVGRLESPDVPVRIRGASGVGGARLAFRFPDDRYEIRGVDFEGPAADWLHLSQVGDGRVRIGLVDAGSEPVAGAEADAVLMLHLALKPGQEPGGELAFESADLTAHDGVRLAAEPSPPRLPLAGSPRLSLSGSRPNPFAAATRFELTLDRPGVVDVAIFDLTGRRLVTLHHGELPAGAREFTWDGRLADGSRVRDGVYFYRALAGAGTLARKLVLLRRP